MKFQPCLKFKFPARFLARSWYYYYYRSASSLETCGSHWLQDGRMDIRSRRIDRIMIVLWSYQSCTIVANRIGIVLQKFFSRHLCHTFVTGLDKFNHVRYVSIIYSFPSFMSARVSRRWTGLHPVIETNSHGLKGFRKFFEVVTMSRPRWPRYLRAPASRKMQDFPAQKNQAISAGHINSGDFFSRSFEIVHRLEQHETFH